MTTVYHGSRKPLKIINERSPRYGIPVIFFTDSAMLASMYSAKPYFVVKADIESDHRIDFKGHVSHSSEFRNLIFRLSKEGHDVVAIENVYDRPNDNYPLEKSTIYVVFNFEKINNLTPIEHASN